MERGHIVGTGAPQDVVHSQTLSSVFSITCDTVYHPDDDTPFTVARGTRTPESRQRRSTVPDRQAAISVSHAHIGYGGTPVLRGVSTEIRAGEVTVIVGANGSGKSTLLRGLAQHLSLTSGQVSIGEIPVEALSPRALAREMTLMGQESESPEGMTATDLVATARYPYSRWYRRWGDQDQSVVNQAMTITACQEYAHRPVGTLSGGQLRRVWFARALAQDTDILLLDEPTTFLDVAHQVALLDLVAQINANQGRTVVMVLHDLCLACRYADNLIALRDGEIVADGPVREVISEGMIQDVFNISGRIVDDPSTQCPLVLFGSGT
jgi:iron complex transport system ATP-binding protein